MKILFVSHGINNTGWGMVTRDLLFALSQKFDVVSRIIPFDVCHDYGWHKQLLDKSTDDVTHVIQYVLPHHLSYFPDVTNIAITEIENRNIEYSYWVDYLNLVDQIWVSNEDVKTELQKYLTQPIHKINHPVNLNKYDKKYNFPPIKETEGTYKFYTIAENTPRKNLALTIKSFHLEFDPSEPVSLLIKSSDKSIGEFCNNVKQSLDLYPTINHYKKDVIITDFLTEEQICGLHQYCDCFVSLSIGESFGYPAIDSQGFGNVAILSDTGGHKELDIELVKTNESIGFGGGLFKHTENARTTSDLCSIKETMRIMRRAYNNELKVSDLNKFSYVNFNQKIENILNNKKGN